jgi:hypothetical protein
MRTTTGTKTTSTKMLKMASTTMPLATTPKYDVIGTDGWGMIEGEDDYFGLIDYYCDGFVDDDFDGVDLFD